MIRHLLALLGVSAAAQADGTATWLWDMITQDGDAIVEPGETATMILSLLMEPDPNAGPFVAFGGSTFSFVGDDNAYDYGHGLSFNVLNDLDELTGDLITWDGVSVYGINAGQLTIFGPFTSDNPIDIFMFEWEPDTYANYEVGFTAQTAEPHAYVWEGDDRESADFVEYPYAGGSRFSFTVVPAPPTLLVGAVFAIRRRRS